MKKEIVKISRRPIIDELRKEINESDEQKLRNIFKNSTDLATINLAANLARGIRGDVLYEEILRSRVEPDLFYQD